LLLGQTFSPCEKDRKRRQEFSDCAAMDDQPLMRDPL
jgi:hypothetical protein